jgi:tRNA(Ile)-lysidine synthase
VVTALTVDHQLRPESRQEAENVAAWCAQNGIIHHILTWNEPKPTTGVQDKARKARRIFLCRYCRDHSIPVLLLGHQADDQAETFIMRLQRGSSLQGLTAMRETIIDDSGVTIIRPLLSVRREALREYARQNNLPFIDDPSNANTAFERPRIRQALAPLSALADGVILSTKRLLRAHHALDALVQLWVRQNAIIQDEGSWLPAACYREQPEEMRLRIILHVMTTIVPENEIPLEGVERLVEQMVSENFAGQTLAGVWVRPKTRDKHAGWLIQKAPERRG